jgi:hypothetical protein
MDEIGVATVRAYVREKMDKHNKIVHDAFNRAKKGEVICITDLMISKEQTEQKIEKAKKALYG